MSENHEDGSRKVNKRSVLKMIGTSGIAAAGFSQHGSASEGSEITTSDMSEVEKKRAVEKLTERRDFQKIESEYIEQGWELSIRKTNAIKVGNRAKSIKYNLVVACFEPDRGKRVDENEQRYVVWTDLDLDQVDDQDDLYQVTGHQFERTESDDSEWKVTKYTVQNSSLNSEENMYSPSSEDREASKTGISPDLNCGSGKCEGQKTTCDSYNWQCILTTAGAYVTTIAACKSCVFGSPSCLYCLGALLTSSGITVGCDYGNGCETEPSCVPYGSCT